ncbi:hypothetical protein VPH35_102057 [Triticum aestivum]
MSPEYAMHFSILSKVGHNQLRCFGFADRHRKKKQWLLQLRAICLSRKSCKYLRTSVSSDPVWTKGNVIELIDPSLSVHPSHIDQVLKCIQIGLLCVQNRPEDRPMMSSVNVMLSSQSVCLPSVSMPAFSDGLRGCSDNDSKVASSNGMTITKLEPR